MIPRLSTLVLACLAALPAHRLQDDAAQATPSNTPGPSTFQERLAGSRAFKAVALRAPLEEFAPFPIYVQRKVRESGDPTRTAANKWGKWLNHTNLALDELVLRPLDRAPREGFETTPLIVLGSRGDYFNYLSSSSSLGRYTRQYSNYADDLGAVVTFRGTGMAHWSTYPALHDLVLGRLAAVAGEPLAVLWIYDGLATFLSYHRGHAPEAIDGRRPQRTFLLALEKVWNDEELMAQFWLRPRELFAVRGGAGLRALPRLRAKQGAKLGQQERAETRTMFEVESWLLVHWAQTTEEGAKRGAFLTYLDAALDGRGSAEEFASAMGLADTEALDRELRRHAERLFLQEFERPISREAAVATELATEAEAAAELARDASALRARVLLEARAALLQGPRGDEEVLAAALWLARTGALEGAMELFAGVGEVQDVESRARLDRGRARVAELLQARDAALLQLAQERGRLRLTIEEGKRSPLRVAAYENGVVRFDKNKWEVKERAAEEIATEEWVAALGKRTSEFGPEWLRGYAMLLAENPKARRYLDGQGGEAQTILDETERDLSRLLALGQALITLREIAGAPVENDEQAAELLELVRAVVADAGQLTPVDRQLDALREIARTALAVRFGTRGLDELIGADLERLDGGRLRLSYDFTDSAQGHDFTSAHDYRSKEHERLAEAARPESSWAIRDGNFGGVGWVCFRHVLEFEGPIDIEAEVHFTSPPGGVQHAPTVMLGVCDDGERHFVALLNGHADLGVYEEDSGSVEASEDRALTMDVSYDLLLRHDGAQATTYADGKLKQSHSVGTRTSGGVFLWSHSYSPTLVRELSIEGRPTELSLERLAAPWVEEQLAALGL